MATVADVITGALRILGACAAEETPSASEQADAFTTLNDMVDGWANQRLALYATLRSTHTLTVGLNPHTVGSGGTFSTTRPIRIDRASLVLASSSNTEFPLNMLTDDEWQLVQGKASSGQPVNLWVESAYPLMKLWLNPVPVAADTLVLYTWQQLGRFTATSTDVSLPPGYLRALKYSLARELAPEYGEQLSQEAAVIANDALADLKRLNFKPNMLACDPALLRGAPFNIISGDRG